MEYTLYLGCTIPARGRNYEASARLVAERVGVKIIDEPAFGCCGFPLKAVDHDTFFLLSARNIALAEKRGSGLMVLCSSCTGVLTEVAAALKRDEALCKKTNEQLAKINPDLKVTGNITIKHFARVMFEDVGIEKIREQVTRPLSGVKVAVHYGCHYTKPGKVFQEFDKVEDPKTLDELVLATGAETVKYDGRLKCCGGALLGLEKDIAYKITGPKLHAIKESGADLMTLACPFCSVMYDANQKPIGAAMEIEFGTPVFYLPQLLGLAMGFGRKDLAFNMNIVKPKALLDQLEIPK